MLLASPIKVEAPSISAYISFWFKKKVLNPPITLTPNFLSNKLYSNSRGTSIKPKRWSTLPANCVLKASGTETYLFKFFQGEDAQGVDQYYIIEVPVVEERHYGTGTTGRN